MSNKGNPGFLLYQRRFKMGRPEGGVISNRYWNLTLEELKCPILILQGFKPS